MSEAFKIETPLSVQMPDESIEELMHDVMSVINEKDALIESQRKQLEEVRELLQAILSQSRSKSYTQKTTLMDANNELEQ